MIQHYMRVVRRIASISMVTIVLASASNAQTYFQKIYGGNLSEEMHSMIRSHDGGFIMVGSSESFGQGDIGSTDAYILKIDSNGDVKWTKTLGLQTVDDIYWIEPVDSAYVICGGANDNLGYSGILVAKISENGNILWQKVIEKDQFAFGYCIRQTTDGGFIIAAETLSPTDEDFLLIKTDGDANVQWSRQMGSSDSEIPFYVLQTTDGGYLISGISRYGFYWLHMYTVKTDSTGNLEWEKAYNTFPYFSKCTVSKVIATADGGYLIAGGSTRNQPLSDIILLKVDSTGTIQWTKSYGGGDAEYCGSILQNSNRNYVVCGESASSSATGYYDALVMLIDSSGHLIKSSVFGKANGDDDFVSVIALNDGSYMLGGNTSSYNTFGTTDFMMMRLDKDLNGPVCDTLTPQIVEDTVFFGDTTEVTIADVSAITSDVTAAVDSGFSDSLICDVATEVVSPQPTPPGLLIYPNPANNRFFITLKTGFLDNTSARIEVLNDKGQIVYDNKEVITGGELKMEISLSLTLPAGIYAVKIMMADKCYWANLILN